MFLSNPLIWIFRLFSNFFLLRCVLSIVKRYVIRYSQVPAQPRQNVFIPDVFCHLEGHGEYFLSFPISSQVSGAPILYSVQVCFGAKGKASHIPYVGNAVFNAGGRTGNTGIFHCHAAHNQSVEHRLDSLLLSFQDTGRVMKLIMPCGAVFTKA